MKKSKVGDLFYLKTAKGKALFQYVKETENCELIRILPNIIEKLDEFSSEILESKELYFIFFPLHFAMRRKLIEFIGNYPLPNGLMIPKTFRTEFINPETQKVHWHKIELDTEKYEYIESPDEEFYELNDWSVWNDTLLRERIEDNWTPQKWI